MTFEFSLSCLAARFFFNFFSYRLTVYRSHLAQASPIVIFVKTWRAGSCDTSITRRNRSSASAEASLDPLHLWTASFLPAFERGDCISYRKKKTPPYRCQRDTISTFRAVYLNKHCFILNEEFKLVTGLPSHIIVFFQAKKVSKYSCTF